MADAGRFYTELADWWPLFSPPSEYEEEAAFHQRQLLAACKRPAHTLLELGSGGGHMASFLKQRFACTLVDVAPGMLDVSRALNPECEHLPGDMRDLRLGRRFDCVFVHDAVVYMTSEEDLQRAMESAFLHCEPGGAALFAPDYVRENFRETTDHGGSEDEERALRYLEWAWDPDPADDTYLAEYAFLLREADGSVRSWHDRHREGLFSRDTWLRLLADVGFEAKSVPLDLSDVEIHTHEIFVCTRPES